MTRIILRTVSFGLHLSRTGLDYVVQSGVPRTQALCLCDRFGLGTVLRQVSPRLPSLFTSEACFLGSFIFEFHWLD